MPTGSASAAAYSPHGSGIAVGGKGEVTLWDARTRTPAQGAPLSLDTANVVALAYDGDGSHIAAGSEAGDVAVWNTQTHKESANLTVPAVVTDVRFGDGGRWLAIAATDGTVRVWDWQADVVLATLQLHAGATRTAEFMPNHPRMILSTGDDGITSVTPCTTCVSVDKLVAIAHAHQQMLRRSSP
jgi:WD40 repeat protein